MQVWAVAKHMISEGVRMKLALVFLALIGLVVLGLPFSITGDSSLTGAVQAFMSYGLNATGFLLGLLTIFLSRSISDEMVNQQIFLVVTKPIPRWQYIVGKWLGISLLNAAFLACAGLTIFGMVHYIKRTRPPIDPELDAAELQNEVLVARHANQTKLPNFMEDAELEYQQNLEQGRYAEATNLKPEDEKARLAQKYEARWRVVGPYDFRVFEFENILCDRSPENEIQLRYKTNVSQYAPDEVFRALWRFGDPYKGTPVYEKAVRHVVGRFHTIRIPADAIAQDRTLMVTFHNVNPYPGEPQFRNVQEFRKSEGVEVLFIVGGFGSNMIRLLTLEMCKLMFLAAVAVLMTTLFSFPVACLVSFTVYILAGTRAFITEALDMSSDNFSPMFSSPKEFIVQSIAHIYNMIHWIIPDFARYDAVEVFITGRNVSLVWVLQAVTELAVIKTVVILALAILFFYRREVAEVSF